MRRAINVITIGVAAFLVAWPASASPAASCNAQSAMTLSGRIHALQGMREEPQAELETYFEIDLPSPVCGKTRVTASTIGRLPCKVGDVVTAMGDFNPPSKMFDTARLRVSGSVSCTPAK